MIKIQIFIDMVLGRDDDAVKVVDYEWKEVEDYDPVENELLDKKARKLIKSAKVLTKSGAREAEDSVKVKKTKAKESSEESSEK